MFKYIIYLITIIIIVYFQFVGTDMSKNSDLKIVQEYLSIPVPINTINTGNHFRLGDGSFVIWGYLQNDKKNIDYSKKQLINKGWKLEKIDRSDISNIYYFQKDDLYYRLSDSLESNEWGECIGYKK